MIISCDHHMTLTKSSCNSLSLVSSNDIILCIEPPEMINRDFEIKERDTLLKDIVSQNEHRDVQMYVTMVTTQTYPCSRSVKFFSKMITNFNH